MWNSVFLTESGKIIIKKEERACFMCLVIVDLSTSYCIQFQVVKLQRAIDLSHRFVRRITEVITLSLLPRPGALNRVTLHWISFWNSAVWKKGLTDYPFLPVKKKKRCTQRHLQNGDEETGHCLVYKSVCKWSGRLRSLTQPGSTHTATLPLGTYQTSVSISLKCLLQMVAVKVEWDKILSLLGLWGFQMVALCFTEFLHL